MERDPDAPHGGYTTKSYIQALRKDLLPYWQHSQLFMQDGSRIHTSTAAGTFLAQHYLTTIDWPAYSPDLNPIEHLWWHLKRRMHQFHKKYNNFSVLEEQWDGFCKALKKEWQAIPKRLI